ncbi:19044_t:CDS:2, partial [Cetraspora pellucida]
AIICEKSTNEEFIFAPTDKKDSYILEYKLLESGDIIFAYSEGIQIFTINSQTKTLSMIYFWTDGFEEEKETVHQSTKRQLTSFIEKINKSNLKYLLLAIKKIIKTKDTTEDLTESWPYDLIVQHLLENKDSTEDSTKDPIENPTKDSTKDSTNESTEV